MQINVKLSPDVLDWVMAHIQQENVPRDVVKYLTILKSGEKLPTFNQIEKVNVLKPVKMENARVFASVDNVCTISSYNKFGDPEVGDSNVLYSGFDGGRYPFPMSVTFGLSVQF